MDRPEMTLSILLDDELARKLERRAREHDASVEDWAANVLARAVNGQPDGHNGTWSHLQDRRLELIAKEFGGGLTAEESQELEGLQRAVAKECEPRDETLLQNLRRLESSVNGPGSCDHAQP
jgi:hypothetical protein